MIDLIRKPFRPIGDFNKYCDSKSLRIIPKINSKVLCAILLIFHTKVMITLAMLSGVTSPSNLIICLVCQLINLPLTCDSLVVVFGNQDLFVSPCRDFVGSHLV